VSTRTDLELIPVQWGGLSSILSLFGLALLAWGASSQAIHLDTGAGRAAALVLLVTAGSAWVVALVLRRDDSLVAGMAIGAMALSGGALVAFAPIAIIFPAVAVLSAAVRWRIGVGAVIAVSGWLAMLVAEVAVGPTLGLILGCLAAMLGGALIGIARRQAVERTELAARTEVAAARVEVEQERATLLSERNHLAREIHDVLAHTLAALSVQLEAFGTVVEAEPDTSGAVRDQLDRTRRLVHEGLEEARGAVQALRDDAAPLDDQLRRLCAQQHAEFIASGQAQPLSARIVVCLYRVAKEALTNVVKHARGASTSVCLSCQPDRVSVTVENSSTRATSTLHTSGGGYGLRGREERLALLDGHLEAGPTPEGWRVTATVPLPAPIDPSDYPVTP
jgi:signal transduction histidine kinase